MFEQSAKQLMMIMMICKELLYSILYQTKVVFYILKQRWKCCFYIGIVFEKPFSNFIVLATDCLCCCLATLYGCYGNYRFGCYGNLAAVAPVPSVVVLHPVGAADSTGFDIGILLLARWISAASAVLVLSTSESSISGLSEVSGLCSYSWSSPWCSVLVPWSRVERGGVVVTRCSVGTVSGAVTPWFVGISAMLVIDSQVTITAKSLLEPEAGLVTRTAGPLLCGNLLALLWSGVLLGLGHVRSLLSWLD